MELLKEISKPGKRGYSLPECDVPGKIKDFIPERFLRKEPPPLPEVSEVEVVRHFVRLSNMNYHIDLGMYPLGSCTMKYNPKINEDVSRFPGFAFIHPFTPEEYVQGALRLMYELKEYLKEISGMDEVSLQPVAGAHGELTGMLLVKAYHEHKKNKKSKVMVPDSAHGTNPASCALVGYDVIQVNSGEDGILHPEEIERVMDDEVACIMITNPNTLGLFETHIKEIADIMHRHDALVYMDGANLNALLGISRPGDFGVDIVHFNLHKTFSTPHGGGGPGGGGVGVKEFLKDFLPVPLIEKDGDKYRFRWDVPHTIGKVATFYGNFGVMVKAYTYIRMLGGKGLREVAEQAIINANYLCHHLKDTYELPYPGPCMHEFVLSGDRQKKHGVRTLDIAKRLLDHGYHAPTIYFPLIVHEALMIEPTETEPLSSLDGFIDAMKKIAKEAEENPERLKNAPEKTPVRRLDEARAARELDTGW